MRKLVAFLASMLMIVTLFVPVHAEGEQTATTTTVDFYSQMRTYWRNEMIGSEVDPQDPDVSEISGKLDEQVSVYLETMNDLTDPEQRNVWSDDALLANVNGAEITVSFDRLKMMAIQTEMPASVYYHDQSVVDKIIAAVQFIIENRYNESIGKSGNWWDSQVGTPKALVDISLIYYDELMEKKPELVSRICKTIDKHVPYANRRGENPNGMLETGANLIDKVAIVLKRSLLDNNHERMVHAKECMDPLFYLVTRGDGFYTDGSFVFHGNIAYSGSYGAVLIDELVNCIAMLSFSDVALGKVELNFLQDQIYKAYFPIITYGGNIVDSVRGRAIGRKAQQGDTMGARVMGTLLQYADIADPDTKGKIQSHIKTVLDQKYSHEVSQDYSLLTYSDIARLKNVNASTAIEKAVITDSYHQYSYMDKLVAFRPQSTFALSMSSNRIRNCETGNAENTKGYYQGQGMTQYYTTDVTQYSENYWALVDAFRLSGVTTGHQTLTPDTTGQNSWAGGATLDGVQGVSGQIINASKQYSGKKSSGISANKSWFVLDDRIVALGSDIANTNEAVAEVETIIDNRRLADNAVLKDAAGQVLSGEGTSAEKSFVLENGEETMGYFILDDNQVSYKTETREGKWYDVNQIGKFTDHTPVSADFVSLAVSHGQMPTASSYQYMVVPNVTAQQMSDYALDPQIQVLQASNHVHALKDLKSNQEYYNFFKAGTSGDITVSEPVSVVLLHNERGFELAVADPQHKLASVDITLNNYTTQNANVISGNAMVSGRTENSITVTVNFPTTDGQSVKTEVDVDFAIASDNYALNRTATASSVVNNKATAKRQPSAAVNGSHKTDLFWASEYLTNGKVDKSFSDGWFMVDLGQIREINQVMIYWNNGKGKRYDIQVSETGEEESFKTVYSFNDETEDKTQKTPRTDTLNFDPVNARFVRMKGIERTSEYWSDSQYLRAGYTIIEFEVRNTLSVRDSLNEAKEMLNKYPHSAVPNLTEEEYNAVAGKLKNAVAKGDKLITGGQQIEDQQIRDLAEEINAAIKEFDSKLIHVTAVTMEPAEMNVNKGDVFTLTPLVAPETAGLKDVVISSDNERIVEVRNDGSLKAVNAGTVQITATSVDSGVTAQTTVHVVVPVEKITMEPSHAVIMKNETVQLKAAIAPHDATAPGKLVYTSSAPEVASVDDKGLVTGLHKGTAVITVTMEGTELKSECRIEVELDYTADSSNLALKKPAAASSVVNNKATAIRQPEFSFDGDPATRWASEYLLNGVEDKTFDQGWLMVDLEKEEIINKVDIYWEKAKAKDYDIQGSLDGTEFFTLYEYRSDDKSFTERQDSVTFEPTKVRYVRMQGIDRSTNYNDARGGYSIYEMEVYASKDYFALMKEAKDLLNTFPSESKEYADLNTKVTQIDTAVENEQFTSETLYQDLTELEALIESLKNTIVFVESVEIIPEMNSILPQQQITLTVKVLPENATNSNVTLTISDETVLTLTPEGKLEGLKPGRATVTAVTEEGALEHSVEITVRTNNKPVITGQDITISLFNDVDPLSEITAQDEEDGQLTPVVETSNLNINVPGVYDVVIKAEDSDGNIVRWTRRITVVLDASSISTVVQNDVTVTGAIPPADTMTITHDSSRLDEYSKLTGQHAVRATDITLQSGKTKTAGTFEIVLPALKDHNNIKVFVITDGQAVELKPSFTNNSITVHSEHIGTIVVTGNKNVPPVPEPEVTDPQPQPEVKPGNGNRPGRKPETDREDNKETEKPAEKPEEKPVEKPEKEEKEPEMGCESSDCGENQQVEEKPETEKTESGSFLWIITGAGLILLLILLVLKRMRDKK